MRPALLDTEALLEEVRNVGACLICRGPIYPPADSVPVWARDENLWERAKERVRPH